MDYITGATLVPFLQNRVQVLGVVKDIKPGLLQCVINTFSFHVDTFESLFGEDTVFEALSDLDCSKIIHFVSLYSITSAPVAG